MMRSISYIYILLFFLAVHMLSGLWAPLDEPPSAKRRRGGWRQQQHDEAAHGAEQAPVAMSQLASRQLLAWADGDLSAQRLEQVMTDAVADGLRHPMVGTLSGIGSGHHAHHGVMELLRRETAVLDDIRSVPGAAGDGACSVLLPSSIIRRIFKHYPAEFKIRFGAEQARVKAFWRQLYKRRNRRVLAEHPKLKLLSMQDLQHMLPLTIHEDCGPITKLNGANNISISSLLGQGSEKVTHYLCATYIKRAGTPTTDNDSMWRALINDFECLYTGIVDGEIVAPTGDANGEYWRFLLLLSKTDEEVRSNEYGLVHYNGAHENCSECLANRRGLPWSDLRRSAGWRGTENMSADAYRSRCRRPYHPLVSSNFFWRYFFFLDSMHLLDCRGLACTVYGSLMGMLVRDSRLGSNQQSRLNCINVKKCQFYDDHPGTHRLPKITLPNLIGASGWFELSGSAIKAAPTRAAAPFFAALAEEYYDTNSDRDCAVREVTGKLNEMYNLFACSPMFLSDADLRRLDELVCDCGTALQYLRCWAEGEELLMWQIRPKAHKVMHLPMMASILNPYYVNCYADESQVGTSVRVWKASVRGRYQSTVQHNVLAKRWLAVLLRFERGC